MATKKENIPIQDAAIESLWQLYQRSLIEGTTEVAEILGDALENFQAMQKQHRFSVEAKDALKQYVIVKGFLSLDKKQQQFFLRHVEDSDPQVIYGVFPR